MCLLKCFFASKTHKLECPFRVIVSEAGTWQKCVADFLQDKLDVANPFLTKGYAAVIDFFKTNDLFCRHKRFVLFFATWRFAVQCRGGHWWFRCGRISERVWCEHEWILGAFIFLSNLRLRFEDDVCVGCTSLEPTSRPCRTARHTLSWLRGVLCCLFCLALSASHANTRWMKALQAGGTFGSRGFSQAGYCFRCGRLALQKKNWLSFEWWAEGRNPEKGQRKKS